MRTVPMQFVLRPEDKADLRRLAEEDQRSMSGELRHLIEAEARRRDAARKGEAA